MKILVSDNLSSLGVDILKKEDGFEVDVNTGLSKEELIKIIPQYEGLVVRSATKVTADVIEAANNLRVIGRAGVGVDNIDLEAAGKKGIIVMNAPDGNMITTAEHAMALMMSMSRNIPQAATTLKQEKKWAPKNFMGVELYGKTLGIVGMGRIGSVVAERAKGFAMKVIAYDPFVNKEHAEKLGVELVELKELLKRSDFMSLHTPKIDGKHLLGKEEFDLVKPGIRIVNCARGGLIDEDALIQAIKDGKVAQAALDVYSKEPLPQDSPLLEVNEIICTPHLGASTEEAQDKVAIAICDQIIDYLKYGSIRNAVNVPSIDEETLKKIKPFLELGEDLGQIVAQLVSGAITQIKIQYNGEVAGLDVAPISISVLKGMLAKAIDGVNMVNAPFIAKERNIEVQEMKTNEIKDYTSTIQVQATTKEGTREITGSIFGKGDPRLVKIDEYYFEAVISKHMLILSNKDVPGVIGNLGNVLGKHNLNIAGFHLGRINEHGNAVSVINIDSPPTSEALRELRETSSVLEVHSVVI
ncbi:phosphoglycerate dehydrogenase [Nitrospina watsonii]|uniref:D-3-phosphoglycerate dehydrogenase n=1 Tax=Nitrospina watsonii TaxID=1323948 RepID=A0ABM9HFS6_9BACT|nr:phosphoglycerate dehydrogenase [Nitrospina watsonii]CAI2719082.1 D-3-phosphoglycerate dehydrogenase [Nitrospina watsonii]